TNSSRAEMRPTTLQMAVDHPGYNWGNQPVARDTVSKTRMMIQLTLISMSIPAILPIRNEPGIVILLLTDVYVRTLPMLMTLYCSGICCQSRPWRYRR